MAETLESLAAYEKALEARPTSDCAKEGIGEAKETFWENPKETTEDATAWLGLLVAALGIVALVLSLLLLLMTYLPVVRNWWPASLVRAVRVSVPSFEDSAEPSRGSSLAALVRSKAESFGSGSKGPRLVDSKAAIEETLWGKFGAISEQAKSFGAFIGLIVALYPERRFGANGVLQADSGSGPGLSLSFSGSKEIVNAVTLWPQQFELGADDDSDEAKAGRLQKLGVPAAAWISHVTITASGKTPGGAKNPLSWALFKTGLEWELDGDIAKAITLYKRAIEGKSANWGALAELGKLENDAGEYEAAIEHLEASLRILQE